MVYKHHLADRYENVKISIPRTVVIATDYFDQFILENEGYERRYYSGFVGWLDPEGVTDIYVNLRCMEIRSDEAKLYAGGGILTSSDILSEWEETGDKMKTMKNIL